MIESRRSATVCFWPCVSSRAFFEGRFKSVAILDDESLLATCADVDLNPVAVGIAEVPECSPQTSIKRRVDHVKAALPGTVAPPGLGRKS